LVDAAQDRLSCVLAVDDLFAIMSCFYLPSTIASTSSSRMMRRSWPSIVISWPEYLPKRIVSPALTSGC